MAIKIIREVPVSLLANATEKPVRVILMDDSSDKNGLPDSAPGSQAYTADMTAIYQVGPSGDWAAIVE